MGGNLSCTSTKRGLKDPDLQPYGVKETEGELDIKTGKAVFVILEDWTPFCVNKCTHIYREITNLNKMSPSVLFHHGG